MAALLAMLAACGGGGGSAGGASTTTGGGAGGGTTTTPSAPKMTVAILDSTSTSTNTIAVGGGYVVRATLVDASNAPIAGKAVTFSLNSAIATLTPGSQITNSSGVAEVAIAPSSVAAIGATTLTASASVDGSTVSGEKDLSVSATSLSLDPIIQSTVGTIASGGNTSLSTIANIGGAPATTVPVTVTFSAACGRINGVAGAVGVTTDGSGKAQVDYTAIDGGGNLCSGSVNVTASSGGAVVSRTLLVAVPTATAITFVTATPGQIYVAGSGAPEQSIVKFKVLSGSAALAGANVVFSLSTTPGGGLSLLSSSGTTNSLGEVSVTMNAGTIPGPVKVRAAMGSDPTIFTETQNLTVASGPPSQRNFSLSVSTFNIEGWNIDGATTSITARVADRQGNAVQDGTVVNFVTEGGQVGYSCATTKTSNIASCSVVFASQDFRPSNGRVSVLAFTAGTKDYVDVNGNNIYDAGTDTLRNLGQAYRDDDENGLYDSGLGEFVIDDGATGSCDPGTYDSRYPGRVNTCAPALATMVRSQTVLLLASSSAAKTDVSVSTSAITFLLRSADNLLLPMPAGSSISAQPIGGACSIKQITPSTVSNVGPGAGPAADLATSHTIFLEGCASGNTVLVTVRSPGAAGVAARETTFNYLLP